MCCSSSSAQKIPLANMLRSITCSKPRPNKPVRSNTTNARSRLASQWSSQCNNPMVQSSVLRLLLAVCVAQGQHPIERLLGIELAYQFLTDLLADVLEAGDFLLSNDDGLNVGSGLQQRQRLGLILSHIRNYLDVVLAYGVAHQHLLVGGELLP